MCNLKQFSNQHIGISRRKKVNKIFYLVAVLLDSWIKISHNWKSFPKTCQKLPCCFWKEGCFREYRGLMKKSLSFHYRNVRTVLKQKDEVTFLWLSLASCGQYLFPWTQNPFSFSYFQNNRPFQLYTHLNRL